MDTTYRSLNFIYKPSNKWSYDCTHNVSNPNYKIKHCMDGGYIENNSCTGHIFYIYMKIIFPVFSKMFFFFAGYSLVQNDGGKERGLVVGNRDRTDWPVKCVSTTFTFMSRALSHLIQSLHIAIKIHSSLSDYRYNVVPNIRLYIYIYIYAC